MFRFIRSMLALCVLASSLPGCGLVGEQKSMMSISMIHDDKRAVVLNHDVQNGITFIGWHSQNSGVETVRICRGPAPDILSGQGSSVSLSGVIAPGAPAPSASVGSNFEALSLGGRSPGVLITRELMYRACELSAAMNLSADETIKIYKLFLDKTIELVKGSSASVGSTGTALTAPPQANAGMQGPMSGMPGMPGAMPGMPGMPGAMPGMPGMPGAMPGMPGAVPGMPGAPAPTGTPAGPN